MIAADLKRMAKMHEDTFEKMRGVSKQYAEMMARMEGPIRDAQRLAEQAFEPTQRLLETVKAHQIDWQPMLDAIASSDLLKTINREFKETSIELHSSKPDKTIRQDAYDYVDRVNKAVDVVTKHERPAYDLRLGPDGRLFNPEKPECSHRLSSNMHDLVRALNKRRYTPTDKLTELSGYVNPVSTQRAIQKLNRLAIGKLGLGCPIAVGQQGLGYKIIDGISIHKVPKNTSTTR